MKKTLSQISLWEGLMINELKRFLIIEILSNLISEEYLITIWVEVFS